MSDTTEYIAAIERQTGRQGRRQGHNTRLLCPVHDDHNPSLDVAEGDNGRPVVFCRSHGCTKAQIDAAIGWPRDLAGSGDGDEWTPFGPAIAVYHYVDEQGQLLHDKCRTADKQFPQRRPDPTSKSGWRWNLDGVRSVLFRLPELIAAVERCEKTYIGEGEKDVLALVKAGVVATCNSGGAGKWRPEYAATFKGADVVIVQHRDDQGRKHAATVAASLKGVAASVSIVEAVGGNDAHDHLEAGHRVDEFVSVPLPDKSEDRGPRPSSNGRRVVAIAAADVRRKQVKWREEGWVPLGMPTVLAGFGGVGKSQLTCLWAARNPGMTLIATAEDSLEVTVRPRLEAAGADLSRVHFVGIKADGDEVTDGGIEDGLTFPDDADELEWLVAEYQATLVIVDPLVAHLPLTVDSHKDQPVRRALRPLSRIADRQECAVVGLMHLNQAEGLRPLQRLSGSGAFGNLARSVLLLDHDPDDPDGEEGARRVLAHIKCNIAAHATSLLYEVEPVVLPAEGGDVEAKTSRLQLIGTSPHNGRAILTTRTGEERLARADAEEFLRAELGEGTEEQGKRVTVATLIKEGRKIGINERTLRRARTSIGAEKQKAGFGRGWEWWLPVAGRDDPEADDTTSLSPSGDVEPQTRMVTQGDTKRTESELVPFVSPSMDKPFSGYISPKGTRAPDLSPEQNGDDSGPLPRANEWQARDKKWRSFADEPPAAHWEIVKTRYVHGTPTAGGEPL